jgi:hypothetical protein
MNGSPNARTRTAAVFQANRWWVGAMMVFALACAGPAPKTTPVADTKKPEAMPPATTPQPPTQSRWVNAVGRIEAGVTVYHQSAPEDTPYPWFTVITPYVEGEDGVILMEVQYDATGNIGFMDRRATMRSPDAVAGRLVIKAGS